MYHLLVLLQDQGLNLTDVVETCGQASKSSEGGMTPPLAISILPARWLISPVYHRHDFFRAVISLTSLNGFVIFHDKDETKSV